MYSLYAGLHLCTFSALAGIVVSSAPAFEAKSMPAQWLAFHYPCTSSLAEKAALMDLGLALLEQHAPLTFG